MACAPHKANLTPTVKSFVDVPRVDCYAGNMDVQFAEPRLALVETHRAAETSLPVAVIQALRHRLNIIRAANDVHTLNAWRSFRLAPELTDNGDRVILINENWRVAVQFNGASPICATIVCLINTETKGADND